MRTEWNVKPRSWAAVGMFASVIALVMASGCASTRPGSASLASILAENTTMAEAHEAVLAVFAADHYQVQTSGESQIVLVRDASRRDKVRYGQYGKSLRMRVDVDLEAYPPSSILVRADAYAVSGGSDLGATKLLHILGGPYQKLLDKVQNRLAKPE